MDTTVLEEYVQNSLEQETIELNRLVNLVNDSIHIESVNGKIVSTSDLDSAALELLAMKIPAECLRIQSALNQYTARNVFRDINIETKVTQGIEALIGTKGNADERRRRAELAVQDERALNLANKTIVKGLQGCIDRADKVYEGIKKVMDFRAREGWFDRKAPL